MQEWYRSRTADKRLIKRVVRYIIEQVPLNIGARNPVSPALQEPETGFLET